MIDLERDLERYGEYLTDTVPAVERDEIGAVRPDHLRRGRWRPVAVVALAASVTMILVGGFVWLISAGDRQTPAATIPVAPDVTEASTPTTMATGTPTSMEQAPIPGQSAPSNDVELPGGDMRLTRVIVRDDSPLGWMRSVVTGGPGFVAVGGTEGGPGVWVSRDGRNWSEVFVGEAPGVMSDIVATGSGLIAAGSSAETEAFWISADGMEWSRLFSGDDRYAEVARSYTEVVAQQQQRAGAAAPIVRPWNPPGDAGVTDAHHMVTSGDGEWLPGTLADPATIKEGAPVEAVVALEDGRFIAVGRRCGYSIALWRSDDGVTWSFSHLEAPDHVTAWDATASDGLLVMVGSQQGGRAFTWAMPLNELQVSQEPGDRCS